MTKYTTRELLEDLLNFVITKDLMITTFNTNPEFLTEPPYSAGSPTSEQNTAWANAGLDIPLDEAAARIAQAIERLSEKWSII